MQKILAFFMSVITFIASLFGINLNHSSSSTTEVTTTETTSAGVVFVQNVAYGTGTREVMDIGYPEGATGNVDVILDVHGGAWIAGSKDNETSLVKGAPTYGYIGAAMNYTYISSKSHCDTILNEITMALKKIKEDAASRGITVNRYIIMGHSAGGHLATLYAYSRGNESGLEPAAVYDRSGPVALEYLSDMKAFISENTLGSTEYICKLLSWLCGVTVTEDNLDDEEVVSALQQVSATHYMDGAVPTIIAHGSLDTIVPYANAVILDTLLTAKGIRHDFVTYPNSGHNLDNDSDKAAECDALLVQYASEYLSAYKA